MSEIVTWSSAYMSVVMKLVSQQLHSLAKYRLIFIKLKHLCLRRQRVAVSLFARTPDTVTKRRLRNVLKIFSTNLRSQEKLTREYFGFVKVKTHSTSYHNYTAQMTNNFTTPVSG